MLCELGRASYHIFLFQILWFGPIETVVEPLVGTGVIMLALSLITCCVAGFAFYRVDGLLQQRLGAGTS